MSRAAFAAVLLAARALIGCEGVVIVEADEAPPPPGPLYCPQEDDACQVGDGVPSPVIVEVDAGSGSPDAGGDSP